jgi:hypothetical protein
MSRDGEASDIGQAREADAMHVTSQHRGQEWRDVTPIRGWAEELVSHGGMNAAVGRSVLANLDHGQRKPSRATVQAPDVAAPIDWQERFRAAAEVAERMGWAGTGYSLYDLATQLNGLTDDGLGPDPRGIEITQAIGRALLGADTPADKS